ncbi:MAG: hypothetical protein GXY61_15030 [Lentisphaerae bacterium]|jgi:hypothetical protein|nr:hypothetical protein [Lentisphaerota bacterium]
MAAVREQGRQDGCGTGSASAALVALFENGRMCMSRRVAQAVLINTFVWGFICKEWMKSNELTIILP